MLKAHMQLAFNDEVPPLYRRVSNGGHDDYDVRDDTDAEQTTAARHHRSADSSPVAAILGDPGGQRTPTFLSGVTYKAVTLC